MSTWAKVVWPALLILLAVVVGVAVWPDTTESTDNARQPAAQPSTPTSSSTSTSASATPTVPARPGGRVLVISLDGFNPDVLDRRRMPALQRLIARGASTLNARTAVERTLTLPNHTSMLTGRPVYGPGGHHVDFNKDTGTDVQAINDAYVPSVFDVAHDAGLVTGVYTNKEKFAVFNRSWDDDSGAPDTNGENDGRDKIDTFVVGKEAALVDEVLADLARSRLDLGLLHFGQFDESGHKDGFMSRQYLSQAKPVDQLLQRVTQRIESTPRLARSLTVIVTADHGGAAGGTSHSKESDPANYRIPFVAWGRGVDAGADLYELNPERRDPDTGQPAYGEPQPVRTLDVAATALATLGLPAPPGSSPALRLR